MGLSIYELADLYRICTRQVEASEAQGEEEGEGEWCPYLLAEAYARQAGFFTKGSALLPCTLVSTEVESCKDVDVSGCVCGRSRWAC